MVKNTWFIPLVIASSIVNAEENKSNWKNQAELGLVLTAGNTDTSTINAKVDGLLEQEKWRHNLHAEVLSTTSNDITSAQKYQASGQSDYKFNETDYAFGRANYEKDKFSGFEYQITFAGGYGRRVLNENDQTLDVEIGPGIRYFKDTPTLQSESDTLLRLAAKYKWNVSSHAVFTQDLSSDIGSDLIVTKSVTALQANINSTLALKFTLTINNNSDVPVGTVKTDTETAVTLVYAF